MKVTIKASRKWMRRNGVAEDDVWSCGRRASIFLEGSEPGSPAIGPCQRCGRLRPSIVSLGTQDGSVAQSSGDVVAFVFDYCRSYCNSSRLHLGGRIVLSVELRASDGRLVSTVRSQPMNLCSKPRVRGGSGGGSSSSKSPTRSHEASPTHGTLESPAVVGLSPFITSPLMMRAIPPAMLLDRGAAAAAAAAAGASASAGPKTEAEQAELSQRLQFLEQIEYAQFLQISMLRAILMVPH
eukprot:m51a1_g9483 hypothetical protein (239) ;mRNA; f:610453-611395